MGESQNDEVFERVVDVHSARVPQKTLADMFMKCGQVNNTFHWMGQHPKPHILIEYASLDAAESARRLSRSDLQVAKVSKNDGLIRKFKELSQSHNRVTSTPISHASQEIKDSTHSPSPAKSRRRPPAARESQIWRRPASPSPKRETRRKNDHYSPPRREPSRRSRSASASATNSRSSLEIKDRSHSNDPTKETTTSRSTGRKRTASVSDQNPVQDMHISKSSSLLRIPYAGEYIQIDLNDQLEDDPSGIIIILSTVEASQQLWMVVAAHYQSKNNSKSAQKVLEAGIDLSRHLGRTDTKPLWHLLDQIKNGTSSESPRDSEQPQGKGIPPQKQWKKDLDLSPIQGIKETPSKQPPKSPAVLANKEILPDIQRQIDKLQDENKALRSKYSDLLGDLSEARMGKRRAEDELKEARVVRRRLERDLKETEDALKRSRRAEQDAMDQVKREIDSRRKTQALLDNATKDQQPQPQIVTDTQKNVLLHITSLIQKLSRSEHSDSQLLTTTTSDLTFTRAQ